MYLSQMGKQDGAKNGHVVKQGIVKQLKQAVLE